MSLNSDNFITIILATGNRDKVKELRPLLENISPRFKVSTLNELGMAVEIEETEQTLEGNAVLKAKSIFTLLSERLPFMIVLADDTGLEVDALNGAPGVYSARYAPMPEGQTPCYMDNVHHLLQCMLNIANRKARFRTVIAIKGRIFSSTGKTILFESLAEGVISGSITLEQKGNEGFGYDPVFLVDSTNKTYGEMNTAEKNTLSHRSLAIKKIIMNIKEIFACNNISLTKEGH
ncbi:MAG: RdgB/HAM1 family non-canonical purine NTP pyrophosphatase [Chlorobiaceae bacterium]